MHNNTDQPDLYALISMHMLINEPC